MQKQECRFGTYPARKKIGLFIPRCSACLLHPLGAAGFGSPDSFSLRDDSPLFSAASGYSPSRITSPLSRARTASSVRLRRPVLSSMLRMCAFTVPVDMCRRSPISVFV